MLASCSICGDVFTGIPAESVHSTPCGHIFHYHCFKTWIESSQTCPHCRSSVTEEQVIKLHLNYSNVKEDIHSLEMETLTIQNNIKDKELKELRVETKKDKNELIYLKGLVKELESKIPRLQHGLSIQKSKNNEATYYVLKAKVVIHDLREEIKKYKSKLELLEGENVKIQKEYEKAVSMQQVQTNEDILNKDKVSLVVMPSSSDGKM